MDQENNGSSYSSCFDVIGPIMVGPSSSHTAGAINIGNAAMKIFKDKPEEVIIRYYESFSETHQGHGTDFAIIAGLLDLDYDDPKVPYSIEIAEENGIKLEFIENDTPSPFNHPNTADIMLINKDKTIRLAGVSIGGGKIEIPYIEVGDFKLNLTGSLPALLIMTQDNNVEELVESMMENEKVAFKSKLVENMDNKILLYYEIEHYFPKELFENIEQISEVNYAVLF